MKLVCFVKPIMREEIKNLVTLPTAANLRGVSHQAILNLIRRGKLTVIEIDGVKFLRRDEVQNYQPSKGGRPKKKNDKE
jgi:hypothetical protein